MYKRKITSSLWQYISYFVTLSLILVACQSKPQLTSTESVAPDATSTPDETVNEPAVVSETQSGLPTIDTFEFASPPTGQDGSANIGFLTWSDGSPVVIEPVVVELNTDLALPDQTSQNTIIRLDTTISSGGWAGFTHAFEDSTAETWQPQDWYPYRGISFWVYGNATGGTIFMDILDNRTPGSTVDDAERWTHDIPDDFEGWQYFEIPFEEFRRKDISNSAPNDGFTLTEIHGYAIGTYGSIAMGAQSIYVDQVALYGVAPERPVEVFMYKTILVPKEGGRTTVNVNLNKASDKTITVQYTSVAGNATPGQDFILPIDNTLTFAPGERAQSFVIEIPDDQLTEGTEQTIIYLYNPSDGAVINPQYRAILRIRDDEQVNSNLIQDFNTPPPFLTTGGLGLSIFEITPDAALAFPDQANPENVLALNYDASQTGVAERLFSSPQDWSDKEGIRFWYYGANSGNEVSVNLRDNKTTSTADVNAEDWVLTWSDEFDTPPGTQPDPGVWQPEIADGILNGLTGWGNGEFEYYTDSPDNASTDGDGNLVITVKESTDNLPCWYGSCEYTSARLITRDRLEFTYGRIEARIKVPYGQGLWPAFWLLGTNIDEVGWPQSGEIDILENIGREPATAYGTVHGPGYSGGQGIGSGFDIQEGKLADDFHIYAIEWSPNELRWYFDETNYFTVTTDDLPADSEWVYDHPFFIILNAAVGGNWPGSPDETTNFPQTMTVDYVRVYGAEDTSENFEYRFKDNFEGWQLITIPFSEFSRSRNQPAGAPNDGLNLELISGYGISISGANPLDAYMDKLEFIETDNQ
jgi:beta-glucanase (GH16 family)